MDCGEEEDLKQIREELRRKIVMKRKIDTDLTEYTRIELVRGRVLVLRWDVTIASAGRPRTVEQPG